MKCKRQVIETGVQPDIYIWRKRPGLLHLRILSLGFQHGRIPRNTHGGYQGSYILCMLQAALREPICGEGCFTRTKLNTPSSRSAGRLETGEALRAPQIIHPQRIDFSRRLRSPTMGLRAILDRLVEVCSQDPWTGRANQGKCESNTTQVCVQPCASSLVWSLECSDWLIYQLVILPSCVTCPSVLHPQHQSITPTSSRDQRIVTDRLTAFGSHQGFFPYHAFTNISLQVESETEGRSTEWRCLFRGPHLPRGPCIVNV